jgi:hypothetical protein
VVVDTSLASAVVDFEREGTVRIPGDDLAGGHLEHG